MPRKKRNNKIFMIIRIIGIFIVGMIVAVIVALSQVNLETLRGNILGILRDATGMPVEIDGAVSWKFSLRPRIQLHQVRIPNASWARHKYAFSADRIDVRLNLLSLFRNRPTIQNVKVYDASVCLEKNSAGQYSIDFMPSATSDEAADAPQPKYPFEDPGLGGVEIKNLVAHIFDDTYSLSGFNVRYMPRHDGREYSGWVRSDARVFPFIVAYSEYNPERKIYPVRIALSTGGQALIANIALEGTSRIPIDFKIKGDIPDMAAIGAVVGLDWEDLPGISIDLAGGYDWRKITMRKSTVAVRGAKITFSGEYDWSKKIPNIKLDLSSDRISLPELLPELYGRHWVRPKRALNVFRDIPLYGTEFTGFNADVRVDIGDFIVYRDLNLRELDAHVNLRDGHARIDGRVSIGGGDIRVGGDADVDKDGMITAVAAGVASDVSIGQIMDEIHQGGLISGLPINVTTYLRGHGKTLSELMSTLTGPVQAHSTAPGYVYSALVANVYGADFLTTLRHSIEDLFRSEKQHNQMKVSCVSLNAKLRNGRMETEHGVAVETNAINLRLAGNLDLGAETLKMSLTTVPVRGLKLSLSGNLVNTMEITGNLAEPDVRISGAAVAGKVASATGLGLLLAPFTGGIGLVAGAGVGLLAGDLLENWLADDEPCKTAMRRGAPAMRGDAAWLNTPIEELINQTMNPSAEIKE